MIDVGFGGFSRATGINDAAEVIGTACYPGGGACQMFVYSQANGTTTIVGSLLGFGSSEGVAINRKHVIVGTSDRGTFTYSLQTGEMTLLNGISLIAVNAAGQVLGNSVR